MGIINGLFGAVRKKIGPLVSRRVNGRNVISIAAKRRPSVTLSHLQLVHQARFKIVVGFLSQITALIGIGFNMRHKIAFAAAVRCNFNRIIGGVYPDFYVDYTQVIFSAGRLQTPNSPSAVVDEQGGIQFSWLADEENAYNRRTDLASFLVYDAQLNAPLCVLKAATRAALGYRVDLPAGFSSTALHCYMSLVSERGDDASRSVYIGCLTISSL